MQRIIQKSWYTLAESAEYLSQASHGQFKVTVSHLMELALDGEITTSLYILSPVTAACGEMSCIQMSSGPIESTANLLPDNIYLCPPDEHADLLDDPGFRPKSAAFTRGRLQLHLEPNAEVLPGGWPIAIFTPSTLEGSVQGIADLTLLGQGPALLQSILRTSMKDPTRNLDALTPWNIGGSDRLLYDSIFLAVNEPGKPSFVKATLSDLFTDVYIGVNYADLDNLLSDPMGPFVTGQSQQPAAPPSDLPHKFQQLYGAIAGGELPDLEAIIDAWYSHWNRRAARGERDTYPKNHHIQAWLEDRGLSSNKAESIPPLIRPKW